MEKFNNKTLANKILIALNEKGANLEDASINIINKVLNETFKSDEKFNIPDCSWEKDHPITNVSQHLECASSISYSTSTHSECPQKLEDAVNHFSKKRKKGDEYDEYWNKQSEIITKITTIREVLVIIRPEDKK